MFRYLFWRLLTASAAFLAVGAIAWLLDGGPGEALRGGMRGSSAPAPSLWHSLASAPAACARLLAHTVLPSVGTTAGRSVLGLGVCSAATALIALALRWRERRRRRYVRLRVRAYRGDRCSADALVKLYESLHKRLLRRWWRRLLGGQPSLGLEAHVTRDGPRIGAWLAMTCVE
ncbi:MAG TPA: hypothetical protein VH025_00760, partial [Solirubrobacteraceae bacterium]|nr:hypothetical protein [Solirubrobacteraceae bacterium]